MTGVLRVFAGCFGGRYLVVEDMIRVVLGFIVIFATLASRLMSGGVVPANTSRNMVFVGRMHPVIGRRTRAGD